MFRIQTLAVAGLWSAITVAALGVVAFDRAPAISIAKPSTIEPVTSGSVLFIDATGNRYRQRRD